MENFFKRVSNAQIELKAPKSQRNNFGNYNYRSCEDILEAAKPICNKYGLLLNLSDEIEVKGERYYVKATATLYDTESDKTLSSTASARESAQKKGMDDSQITGTASSYARKYALNGLFNIDDTKDADTDEYAASTRETPKVKLITHTKAAWVTEVCKVHFGEKWQVALHKATGYSDPAMIPESKFAGIKARLDALDNG